MTRVLVVDDEIDTLNLLRTILEISGFQPVTTLNSVDAITLAEVEHPDVVLLDIMMPVLDGFTLCKMMRVNPLTMHLPIVFVTAYSSLDLEDRRKEAGADMVLPKPIGMDTLIAAVELATSLRPAKIPEPPAPPAVVTPPVAASVTDTQESKTVPSTDSKAAAPTPELKPAVSTATTSANGTVPATDKKPGEA